jgi:Domain of unknown function (DUF1707)
VTGDDGGGTAAGAGPEEVPGGPKASDADRERFAKQLNQHYAEGRLSDEDYQARIDRVFAARTLIELYSIISDLPHPGPTPVVGWTERGSRRGSWWRRRG